MLDLFRGGAVGFISWLGLFADVVMNKRDKHWQKAQTENPQSAKCDGGVMESARKQNDGDCRSEETPPEGSNGRTPNVGSVPEESSPKLRRPHPREQPQRKS